MRGSLRLAPIKRTITTVTALLLTGEKQFTTPESTVASAASITLKSAQTGGRVVVQDSSGLAKGLNKELTCSICLELFKTPKMLPCLHTFCEKCLKQIATQSKQSFERGPPGLAVVVVAEPKGIKFIPACMYNSAVLFWAVSVTICLF